MRRALSGGTAALLCAAVVALWYGPLARFGEVLAVRDVPRFHLPLRSAFAAAARHGLPTWNPWIHGGQPILSNPNYAAFYPPTWLALALPPATALHLLLLLHAVLAFAGAWSLARRLGCGLPARAFAALAFAGSGAVVATAGTVTLLCGLAWLPWILRFGEELFDRDHPSPWPARLARAAAALALQLLAGEPVVVLTTLLALACLALERRDGAARRLAWLAAAGAGAAALAAVQLAPTLRRLAGTDRGRGLETAEAATWSLPPERLVEWILPRFFGDPMRAGEGLWFGWGVHDLDFPYLVSIYPGLLVVVLGLAALLRWPVPRRAAWAAMLALSVLLALGRHNPLVAAAIDGVPALRLLRYPEKFLLLAAAALPFAAALGWQHLLERRRAGGGREADFPAALAAVAAGVALALGAALWLRPELGAWFARRGAPLPPSAAEQAAAIEFLRSSAATSAALAAVAAALLAAHRWRRVPERALLLLLPAALAADLWLDGRRLLPTVDADLLFEPSGVARQLAGSAERVFSDAGLAPQLAVAPSSDRPGPAALWSAVDRMEPYLGNLWGVGYVLNEDTDRMLTDWAGFALGELRAALGDRQAALRLIGAWSADHVLRSASLPEILRARLQGEPERPLEARPNPYRLPRVRLARRVRFHPERAAAAAAARAQRWDLSSVEHWVAAGRGGTSDADPRGELARVEEGFGRIEIATRSPGELALVVAVTFDRGWRARVDGRPVEPLPTAAGQIGLWLPPGTHEIELAYRQPALAPAAALSAAAWLVALGAWAAGRRRAGGGRDPVP